MGWSHRCEVDIRCPPAVQIIADAALTGNKTASAMKPGLSAFGGMLQTL